LAARRLGQHFLKSSAVLERIARAACADRELLVVEIGPGRGALTARLLARAERIIAIEIDTDLVRHLRRKFAGERLEVIEGDALEIDLGRWGPAVMAGNLPYYAATRILERVTEAGDALRRGVFLVQKEVAERAAAAPGSRDYGYFSVALELFVDVERLFDVPPGAFQPPPEVDSTLLRLTPHDRTGELGISDAAGFLRFVSDCFRQKRKTLRNNLARVYGRAVDEWPEAGLRAEQIHISNFAAMYRRVIR
jgi:16S rRNA (adenine1518-N6/adenine1519-N6)-dimethyltransferase